MSEHGSRFDGCENSPEKKEECGLFGIFGEKPVRLAFQANAVRVSANQFPRIHHLYAEVLETMDAPERYDLFIAQNPIVNAGAYGMDEPFIILNSATNVLLDDDEEAEFELHVRPTDVVVNRSARLSFNDPDWVSHLRRSIRPAITAESIDRRASVRVRADDEVTFERFVSVLGAADDGCLGGRDCGLPGMGLRFALVP